MIKYFVRFYTGYCGSEGAEVIEFPEGYKFIEEELWYQAIEHASMYGYELCDDDCDDYECEMEHPGNTNIDFSYELYVPEKHDRYIVQ